MASRREEAGTSPVTLSNNKIAGGGERDGILGGDGNENEGNREDQAKVVTSGSGEKPKRARALGMVRKMRCRLIRELYHHRAKGFLEDILTRATHVRGKKALANMKQPMTKPQWYGCQGRGK